MLDETHDPTRRSWVTSANDGETDFPLQNLPFGVFRPTPDAAARVGVAIGDQVFDLSAACERSVLPGPLPGVAAAARSPSLNPLISLGRAMRRDVRAAIAVALRDDTDVGQRARSEATALLHPQAAVTMDMPVVVGDYTDFYASIHHATNVGKMMRPDNPLLPNYKWMPIGYHGRASSLVVSGTPIHRPSGQTMTEGAAVPAVGASARMDYEAEIGFFVGEGNTLGTSVPVGEAFDHYFGVCLVNDWSARDIQAWEYQPLGPFLSKSFATTISPWVVTPEALAPFRTAVSPRAAGDPAPLPYLTVDADQRNGAIDLTIEVRLQSARMRQDGIAPMVLSRGNARDMYWTPAQLLAHHSVAGCNLRVGDLLASGTISGPTRESRGCLLELTWRGTEPIALPGGEVRRFLEDGDEVTLRGRCSRDGATPIGFGDCRGVLLPSAAAVR